MNGWLWLLAAGVVEIAWAQSIPPTKGLTRFWPSVLCIALCVAIIWLLARATDSGVPVSTAYVVFTGMGAAGAVLLGLAVLAIVVRRMGRRRGWFAGGSGDDRDRDRDRAADPVFV